MIAWLLVKPKLFLTIASRVGSVIVTGVSLVVVVVGVVVGVVVVFVVG